jgi:hypothetical protein
VGAGPLSARVVIDGGIAQLVEHKLCKLGVTGSNPVASTIQPDPFSLKTGV